MRKLLPLIILLFVLCLPLAVNAQGGMDVITGGPGNWSKNTVNANNYVAVVADGALADRFYGARKGGGIDCISKWNGTWYTDRINIDTTTVNNYKYVALCADSGGGQLVYAARADGGLDRIAYEYGGWGTSSLNQNKYVALTSDNVLSKSFFGARADGGIDSISEWQGTYYTNRLNWDLTTVNTTKYVALTCDNSTAQQVFGARLDGGLDRTAYEYGGWGTETIISSSKYLSLTYDSQNSKKIYAACEATGIDAISNWQGNWIKEHLAWSENPYSSLATDPVTGQKLYAVRRDTGLEMVMYSGGGWSAYGVNSDSYVAVAACAINGNQIFGAKTLQGVEEVSISQGNWTAKGINTNDYISIVADGVLSDRFYGARKDGGVDCLSVYNGTWYTNRTYINGGTTPVINTYKYVSLCADSGIGQCIYAARADGGVDKIDYTWTWQTTPCYNNSVKYITLTSDNALSKRFYGARVDGGVDCIDEYNGTYYTNRLNWDSTTLNTYKYVALTCDKNTGRQVFAAREEGGVDKIAYTWTWQTTPVVVNDKYMSLTYDSQSSNRIYGACAATGVDSISLWAGNWIKDHLAWSEYPYGALATDPVSGQKIFAARRNGQGLDTIKYAGGGWCAYGMNVRSYSAIAANSVLADTIYLNYGSIADLPPDPVFEATIADAKKYPDNTIVKIAGVVSAPVAGTPTNGYFYLEAINRESGIRVERTNHGRVFGNGVAVTGKIKTLATGERYISAITVDTAADGSVLPLGMTNKTVCGGDQDLASGQKGAAEGVGLNNVGLLIRVWGNIVESGYMYVVIDDGSGVLVKIDCYNLSAPPTSGYIGVTGICTLDNGYTRMVVPRDDNDLMEY